jgi:PAS domain S-box-containing protein
MSAEEVGKVTHINDEIFRTLGYSRKDLIGKNIKEITPAPIAVVHDLFLTNFLETAKSNMLNMERELFALTKDGYLRTVKIMLQLYPVLQEKISVLGFIQPLERLEGLIPQSNVSKSERLDMVDALP